jgi:hypothetical protein
MRPPLIPRFTGFTAAPRAELVERLTSGDAALLKIRIRARLARDATLSRGDMPNLAD